MSQDDDAGADEACWRALWAALHVNRFVLQQTWAGIEALPMPSEQRTSLFRELRQRGLDALDEVGSVAPDATLVTAARTLLAG